MTVKMKLAIAVVVIIVVVIVAHLLIQNVNPTDMLRELHGA